MSADCHAGLGGCRAVQGWLLSSKVCKRAERQPLLLPHVHAL